MTDDAPCWLSHGQVAVLGTGATLPGPALSTHELLDRLTARFAFARQREAHVVAKRLGITHRHICRDFDTAHESARPGHSNPELAANAVRRALTEAGVTINDVGYLIGHTTTPHQPLPGNIAFVADRLGYRGPHVELRQACTGFANALMIAFGLLAAPGAKPVVIVGSETGSLFFDPARAASQSDQIVNLVQMGDAAAAIVLAAANIAGARIESAWFGSVGLGAAPGIQIDPAFPNEFAHDYAAIQAKGARLFEAGQSAVRQHGISLNSVDTIIPHQVNGNIGALVAAHFDLPASRFFGNAARVGNTGSAAIWLALAELRAGGLAQDARTLVLGAEASKHMHGGFVYTHG